MGLEVGGEEGRGTHPALAGLRGSWVDVRGCTEETALLRALGYVLIFLALFLRALARR